MEYKSLQEEGYKFPCKYCKSLNVWYNGDETTYDGAYDIYHYKCYDCSKEWRVVDETD